MIERRYTKTSVELRGDDGENISGVASVFYDGTPDTEFELWEGGPVERIMPTAFERALEDADDVVALFNHEPSQLLGRTPDSLRLWTSSKGLHYETPVDDTQVSQEVRKYIKANKVRGSSFAFTPESVEWTEEGDKEIRNVKSVRLYDVSPVTRPAYSKTSASLRGQELSEIRAEHAAWKEHVETEKRFSRLDSLFD